MFNRRTYDLYLRLTHPSLSIAIYLPLLFPVSSPPHPFRLLRLDCFAVRCIRTGRLRLELCADVIVSAAARRSISAGGGAPPVQKNRRRRRGVGGQKQFF